MILCLGRPVVLNTQTIPELCRIDETGLRRAGGAKDGPRGAANVRPERRFGVRRVGQWLELDRHSTVGARPILWMTPGLGLTQGAYTSPAAAGAGRGAAGR